MEDSPRSHNKFDSDTHDSTGSSEKKQSSTQEFLSRWRRFSEKKIKTPEQDLDKLDDDEDDEDDGFYENKKLSPQVRRRYKRLRQKLKPFLPQSSKVVESATDNESRSSNQSEQIVNIISEDISTTREEYDESELSKEKAQQEVEQSLSLNGSSTFATEPNVFESADEPISREKEPTIEDQSLISSDPVSEPESIERILRRTEARDTLYAHENNRLDATTNETQHQVNSQQPLVRNQEINNTRNNISGLLAVDLLNYRIAKRRDKKNMLINKKEQEIIKTDQSYNQDYTQRQIDKLKLQQERHEINVKNSKEFNKIPLTNQSHETIYNRSVNKKREITKDTVNNSEQKTELNVVGSQEKQRNNEPASKSFENTLKHVARAEDSRIVNEFEFERRHEVKDEPGGGRPASNTAHGIPEFDPYHYNSAGRQKLSKIDTSLHEESKPLNTTSDNHVYKQAAATGFWAAVTGIVIFIIIYVLGSV
jgi:hypothetical protein